MTKPISVLGIELKQHATSFSSGLGRASWTGHRGPVRVTIYPAIAGGYLGQLILDLPVASIRIPPVGLGAETPTGAAQELEELACLVASLIAGSPDLRETSLKGGIPLDARDRVIVKISAGRAYVTIEPPDGPSNE